MTFKPFVVNCLTCGSTLRVTDPAIVGTIASCPKCESMVQINGPSTATQATPPPRRMVPGPNAPSQNAPGQNAPSQIAAGQIAAGQSSIDSEAITEDAIAAADFDAGESDLADSSSKLDRSRNPSPFSGHAPSQEDRTSTVPSSVGWQSERTVRSRQIALITTLAIASLVVAASVFGWFVSTWQDRPTSRPVAEADANPAAKPDPADPDSESPVVQDPVGADVMADRAEEPETSPKSASGQANDGPVLPQDTDVPKQEIAESAQNLIETPVSNIPNDLVPTSPLKTDTDPASVSDAMPSDNTASSDSPTDQDADNIGATELPPEFAKYTQILPVDGSLDKPTLEAPPTIDDVELEQAASDDEFELSEVKPRELNLRRDLGTRLAISSESYPLADLLLLAGQLTTVPLEIDWVSFDIAGIETGHPVAPPTGWKTARGLIDELAASLNCQWIEEETLLVLTPTDTRFSEAIAGVVDLADFGDEQASAVTILTSFLQPGSGAPAKTLQIGKDRHEQQLAALSVEALRRMRGIEAKISDQRLKRWAAAAPQKPKQAANFEWPLLTGGKSGPQIDAPISLAGFLLDIARRNQATCLINWGDLNRRGIGPETLHFPPIKADAASTLRDALSRWDIQVRSAGERHWWIGSQSTYDRLPVLVWTAKLGDQRTSVSERIQIVQAAHPGEDIRIIIDPISDRALLKMPRYVAHQLSKILPTPISPAP